MLTYEKLSKNPKSFLSVTGITLEQFDKLYPKIESQYELTEKKRLSRKDRVRDIGAGRRFKHSCRDRVLLVLFYYRAYTSQTVVGLLYDLHQSNVSTIIQYMEPAIKAALPLPKRKLADAKQIRDMKELAEAFPELRITIDASEQRIPRPKNKTKRKTHYSGKKKMHTVKTQYVINADGEIVHRTPHSPGRKHDYAILKLKTPELSTDLEILIDLGYLGMKKDYPDLNIRIPHKKPKGGKLDAEQKEYNRALSKIRVKVEHIISRIKKFGIMRETFRNKLSRYDTINAIICGIVNYKLKPPDLTVVP